MNSNHGFPLTVPVDNPLHQSGTYKVAGRGRFVAHPEGIVDDETRTFFIRLMDESGLPSTRRLELISAEPLRNGAIAMHYRRAR